MMGYEEKYNAVHHVWPWGFQVFNAEVKSNEATDLASLFTAVEAGPFWTEATHLREAMHFQGIENPQWIEA